MVRIAGAVLLIVAAAAFPRSSRPGTAAGAADQPAVRHELIMGAWHAYQRGDCTTAVKLFNEAAEHDPPDAVSIKAASILGDMYEGGRCVQQDEAQALRFFSRAAATGDMVATFNVGVLADRMHDYSRALTAYRAAAEKGYPPAEAALASHYYHGIGVVRDDTEAVTWYRRAAEHHHAFGEFGLGYAYDEGIGGLPKDGVQAEYWYRRAAEQGYALAQANLGWLYSHGRGVAFDHAEAVRWYRLAAEQQVPSAMNSYGFALDQGNDVTRDVPAAITWYRRAAQYGQPNAMHSLAGHYALGTGVDRNLSEALYWALLADRFYTQDPKQDEVRRMIVELEQRLKPEIQQAVRQRVAAFAAKRPPQLDMPSVQKTLVDSSIRERLRNDRDFRLYTVTFAVNLDIDGQVLSLRVVQIADPAAGTADPVDVAVPTAYVDAVRERISKKPPPGLVAGKAATFFTYFFFSPAYPAIVITDLEVGPADQP